MKKYVLLGIAAAVAFSIGYGAVAEAWPIKGRQSHRGYFLNILSTSGDHVWRPGAGPASCRGDSTRALPMSVNSKAEFIRFVKCKLNSGNAQERVGAAFIIQTMRGTNRTNPPTAAQIADWEARINNPAVTVSWAASRSYTVNSFYQGCCGGGGGDPVDDAFFNSTGSDNDTIVFRHGGNDQYLVRRQCANPVGDGSIGQLPPAPNFSMTGQTTVNGGTSAQVLPGDTVDFRHSLTNRGPGSTSPTSINWSTPTVGPSSGSSGNAGTFSNGQTRTPSAARQTFTVPASANPGTQYCSRISFNPRTQSGGSGNSAQRCAEVQYDFDLEPRINVIIRDVDGQDVSADGVAEAGFTIEFQYSVRNNGRTVSQNVTCTYRQATHSGHNTSAPQDTFTPPGANCDPSRTFPRSSTTTIAQEPVPASEVNTNTTICRSLTINPATHNGGTESVQSCVPVVAKPYPRIYGGDVLVGSGFSTATNVCTNDENASAIGWSRRAAGGFAGAGGQYAVLALGAIRDFSTALGNSGGAPPPRGLAFANTTANVESGMFGGLFESAPCIPDYYGEPEQEQTLPGPNLTSLSGGTYFHNGTLNGLGGDVNPGERITVYVNGDVFVSSDIVYPGSWDVDGMPRLVVVAQGNIYISPAVSRMDGIYIAQPGEVTGGVIHTCATSTAALPRDGNLFDTCNNQLVVNGAFIAEQIRLLRTNGTLAQSSAGDAAPGGGAAGEVFNFNPTLWIDQPPDATGESGDYDSIISLPPIL